MLSPGPRSMAAVIAIPDYKVFRRRLPRIFFESVVSEVGLWHRPSSGWDVFGRPNVGESETAVLN